ncbi:MAG: DNA-binding protein [Thermoprotei archaeon]|nr:MAG: DNA-binding protein [Thermoprotei archaeon]
MPRRVTSRIIDRKDEIYEYLKTHKEVPTSVIVKDLNLSHSQTFYILRMLLKEGKIKEIKRGKVAYWTVSDE